MLAALSTLYLWQELALTENPGWPGRQPKVSWHRQPLDKVAFVTRTAAWGRNRSRSLNGSVSVQFRDLASCEPRALLRRAGQNAGEALVAP
jgi:hypothetical protein